MTKVAEALLDHKHSVLESNSSRPGAPGRGDPDPLWEPAQRESTAAAFAAAPHFILLDFRHGPLFYWFRLTSLWPGVLKIKLEQEAQLLGIP